MNSFSLTFDGPGSTAAAFAPAGLTIGYGQYVPTLDGFGDPIPGSDHWELDSTAGPVPVINPSIVNWGTAPSPSKALDVRDGAVLAVFNTPFSLAYFSTALDTSTFGNLGNSPIQFFDADNNLLSSINVDQTVPGFVGSGTNLGLVKTILLPPTAFYDNLTAVPEPGTLFFGLVAMAAAGGRRIRSRRA